MCFLFILYSRKIYATEVLPLSPLTGPATHHDGPHPLGHGLWGQRQDCPFLPPKEDKTQICINCEKQILKTQAL